MADDIRTSIDELMRQAKTMQDNMQAAQDELVKLEVTGTSNAKLVSVTLNGQHFAKSAAGKAVKLHSMFLDEELEDMEDLIAEAINSAVEKVEAATKEKMMELTSKMGLPTDGLLPPSDTN